MSEFPQSAIRMVERLRELDTQRVVFGASKHRYQFNPPLAIEQVEAFEQRYNITLPTPYRRFITEVGNVGAGPYYGVMPLEFEAPYLLQPFPSTEPFELSDDDDDRWDDPIPGAITVAEYGSGIFMLLVVRGDAAGEVWVDARYESGFSPIGNKKWPRMTFDLWWTLGMQEPLDRFENTAALMKAATPHEEIHKQLEPGVLQLDVDLAMLSIIGTDPNATPSAYADKPWGAECGLVNDHYSQWLQNHVK